MVQLSNIYQILLTSDLISSNTGNIARILLRNAEKLAPIIKIDVTVIEGLAKVWIALSCGYTLDPVIFGALADEVDELMIAHVSWHPSVPAVHLNIGMI